MRQLQKLAISILTTASLSLALPDADADVVTVTVSPVIPTNEPEWKSFPVFTSAVLNSTNTYRTQHNASALSWNKTLADYASGYLHDVTCDFKHSGGPYGENLAMGYRNATDSVNAWGDERRKYDFGEPGFSEETGHFTQLVWRATKGVGCGRRLCGDKGWYLVCEYWPPGNVGGEYAAEVEREVKHKDDKSDGKDDDGKGDEGNGEEDEGGKGDQGDHEGGHQEDGETNMEENDEKRRTNDYGILAMGFLVFGMVFYMVFWT